MQIQDIVSKIYFLTKTNSASFAAADMLILINNAYERVASLIMNCDNRWQWDDSNFTSDFPIATTNLVASQADYTLATTHLKILRVECAVDAALSSWTKLEPYDQQDESGSLTQNATVTGLPYRYDELGASVILDPTPSYSATAGLKIYFQRPSDNFTSAQVSTGTKTPGFNPLYHDLIPLWVAYEYATSNLLPVANNFLAEINRKEEMLKKDYNSRNQNDHKLLTMKDINFT